jgi:hypothetical protein
MKYLCLCNITAQKNYVLQRNLQILWCLLEALQNLLKSEETCSELCTENILFEVNGGGTKDREYNIRIYLQYSLLHVVKGGPRSNVGLWAWKMASSFIKWWLTLFNRVCTIYICQRESSSSQHFRVPSQLSSFEAILAKIFSSYFTPIHLLMLSQLVTTQLKFVCISYKLGTFLKIPTA